MNGYYIISAASSAAAERDVREMIPDALLRRRMGRVVRTGVATAMECLAASPSGADGIDAVITATGLGCLADSEKFLCTLLADGERLLNPTPFIQSTFNTVGAQVALLCRNRSYNMTYVHRNRSFECALIDAMMLLDEGAAHTVLAGAFDEITPSQSLLMERMGLYRKVSAGEGADFFVVSDCSEGALARIESVELPAKPLDRPDDGCWLWESGEDGVYFTVTARRLWRAVRMVAAGAGRVGIYGSWFGRSPSKIIIAKP